MSGANTSDGHNDFVNHLNRELTKMAIAQYDTPEFELMFSTPLTRERARIHAILTVYYGINRRDCWAYVQARCPYSVKKTIWEHEKDELSLRSEEHTSELQS